MNDTSLLSHWIAEPAPRLVLPGHLSHATCAWLERALPLLEAVFRRTLSSRPVHTLERLRALPSPLPELSWSSALEGYANYRCSGLTRLSVPEQRIARSLLTEFVHIVRLQARTPEVSASTLFATPLASSGRLARSAALGFCDAALRPDGRAAVGVVLRSATGQLCARIAIPARACDVAAAEASALVAALACAHSLGLQRLALYTDALGLRALLQGRAAPQLSRQAASLQSLRCQFDGLAVYKVPRLFLHQADRLAASALPPFQ